MASADPKHSLIVAGLPGHYSVRGDWFLAVAKGSRSPRLGERAMDILCSRRGNVTRLQSGIGLPVRNLVGPDTPPALEERLEFRTALSYTHADGRVEPIFYRDLRQLGAYDELDGAGRAGNFFWFWRSTIDSYDLHARIWQKWLNAALKAWRSWAIPKMPAPPSDCPLPLTANQPWLDGFTEYDYYRWNDLKDRDNVCFVSSPSENTRWDQFSKFCDGLIEALDRASM